MLRLTLLDLSHNNISHLKISNFYGLINLETLKLDFNNINNIPSATFQYLKKLNYLSIRNNQIGQLPKRLFYMLDELRTLDLSHNPLNILDVIVFEDIPFLETLRCSGCSLLNIDRGLLLKFPHLRELDLSYNYIESIEPKIFYHVPSLKILNLNGNRLTEVVDNFLPKHRMTSLGLGNNIIRRIGNYAFRNMSIAHLDVSYNDVDDISRRSLEPILHSLRDLDLSGNRFTAEQIRRIIKPVRYLENLTISDMKITDFPYNMFKSQTRLIRLNMSRNYLTDIPYSVLDPLSLLSELDIAHNEMRGVSEDLLEIFDRVNILHMEENPWACDICNVPALSSWLNHSIQFKTACAYFGNRHCLKCVTPYKWNGVPLQFLNVHELGPCTNAAASSSFLNNTPHMWVLVSCSLLLVLCIAAIITIVLYNRHSAQYYTHEDERTFENVTIIPGGNGINYPEKKASIATIDEITVLKEDPKGRIINGIGGKG